MYLTKVGGGGEVDKKRLFIDDKIWFLKSIEWVKLTEWVTMTLSALFSENQNTYISINHENFSIEFNYYDQW